MPADKYTYWLDKIGQDGKQPSVLKSFRFKQEDLALLKGLKERHRLSEVDIIRLALSNLSCN